MIPIYVFFSLPGLGKKQHMMCKTQVDKMLMLQTQNVTLVTFLFFINKPNPYLRILAFFASLLVALESFFFFFNSFFFIHNLFQYTKYSHL